jgi:hypothetical protein
VGLDLKWLKATSTFKHSPVGEGEGEGGLGRHFKKVADYGMKAGVPWVSRKFAIR